MSLIRCFLFTILTVAVISGCGAITRHEAAVETNRGLVGAWIVTASRPGGVGKNLLTFSSDGTFFRSGDTHPVLSGAHAARKRAAGSTLRSGLNVVFVWSAVRPISAKSL